MASFLIEGGSILSGNITPQGAKNEALQVICACLLTPQPVTIHNIPNILDIIKVIELLSSIGVEVTGLGNGSYTFAAREINLDYMQSEEFRLNAASIRGSIMIMGPLVTRYGLGSIPRPGGDKIGRRRLDTHILGFKQLGANFQYENKTETYLIKSDRLKGAYLHLDESSVTGTANIVMAATLASGTTTIYNAACEPYVQQLCKILKNMGANIAGVGSNLLTINGVEELHGTDHTLLPDMIEVGSFIGMAALTQSEITIKNAGIDHLGIIPLVFQRMGIELNIIGDDIQVKGQHSYEIETFIDGGIMTISDSPWPGFTPDLLSVALVTAIQSKGTVLFHQKMFESRLFFVDKLIDMGAQIILCDPHRATVIGLDRKQPLRGIKMNSPDIRAGISLLVAAMSAEGESTVYNAEQIDRGYQDVDSRLNALGAKISRIK